MTRSQRVRALLYGTVAVVVGLLLLAPAASAAPEDEERIVAIGDIHGSLDGLLAILQAAGLADAEGSWTGGRATLVQVGDFTDRGHQVRQVMDTLMRLQDEAAAAGGEVVVLLGNHETMNLMGDLRDVTPEIYRTFATESDEGLREQAWEQWVAVARQQARWRWEVFNRPTAEDKEEYLAARPPGYFEYLEAFGPEGHYGRWLRSLPTVARVGETLFVHGGISPEVASLSVEEINAQVAQELQRLDRLVERAVEHGVVAPYSNLDELIAGVVSAAEALQRHPRRVRGEGLAEVVEESYAELVGLREWLGVRSDGPLWFRGYGRWEEEEGQEAIEPIVEAHGVKRVVVGHTPPQPPSDIQMRFQGRVFLIDTGMLEGHYPGGRPSALELVGDRATAIYLDESVVLSGGSNEAGEASRRWIGPDGDPLPFTSDEEVLGFIRYGEILEVKDIPVGVTRPRKLLLERDGVQGHAIFRYEHVVRDRHQMTDGTLVVFFRDSYKGEPAAYELARLLGLDSVPPTAPRRLARLGEGSIQVWIENAMTELDRRERALPPPDPLRYIRQIYNMIVFDNLVNNTDRNLGNILIGPDWKIWYIDCTRCFSRNPHLPQPDRVQKVERRLWEGLQSLDHRQVRQRLGPYLGPGEVPALLRRHAMLVDLIRSRIEELGEEEVLFDFGDDSWDEAPEMPDFPTGIDDAPGAPPAADDPVRPGEWRSG